VQRKPIVRPHKGGRVGGLNWKRPAKRKQTYLGGAGVKVSRLRPGSGFGLGLGAFLTSFLPLSLLPMGRSVTQNGLEGKERFVRD
jgi:hypothetical protein